MESTPGSGTRWAEKTLGLLIRKEGTSFAHGITRGGQPLMRDRGRGVMPNGLIWPEMTGWLAAVMPESLN
jgi:hypothetical protein